MSKLNYKIALILFLFPAFAFAQDKLLKLEDIWASPKLFARTERGFLSMKDGEHYTNIADAENETFLVKYNFSDGKSVDTLLNSSQLTNGKDTIELGDYSFSEDETKILLSANEEAIYRNSSRADYYVFDRSTKKLSKVSVHGKMMYCRFSPTADKVAYVRENNLYITDLLTGNETAITSDGKKNEIINGATDWVYEEEFSMDVAFSWSIDGKKIAYYKFDESKVKEFDLTYYGSLYPKVDQYKYPKAGEENSKVDIWVFDVISGQNKKMETGTDREYLPRMQWTKDANTLSIQRSNRHQNILELLFCNSSTGSSKVILTEKNDTYVEITDDLTFLSNGKQFIWSSTRDGFNHIYLYNTDGSLVKQITKGQYDITKYYGYDEKFKTFYFQSTEQSPMERNIYSITLDGKKSVLTPSHGTHNVAFSANYHYFTDTYSSFGTPYVCTVNSNQGKVLRTLEDNAPIVKSLSEFKFNKVEYFNFKTTDGTVLLGWMIKPSDFDPSKQYPLLMNVYGGPGIQTVTNEWDGPNYLWHQLLAQKGYIIMSVDNRGTIGRGLQFANCIYKDMGKLEVEDQLAAVNYAKTLPYINGARVGVWGWSFGGYMTSLLMTKGNGVYKAGIAVAPVITWRYYDSIYTERYLQTPQENPKGYDDNSPITFAKDLKGKFMLVHGSSDDNVHMQNSMDFINALVKANKQFDLMIYPNRNHNISGGGARLHLYTKMTDFILTNL